MSVTGRWNEKGPDEGKWYDGQVISVNTKKQTIHIKFEDGDEDTDLPWKHVVIPGEEEERKG